MLVASAEDRPLVEGAVPEGVTFAFGDAPAEGVTIRFGTRRLALGERLVAPDGADLWRRAPWPAADELFELALPPPDASALVVDADPARRAEVGRLLQEHGVVARLADRLRRADLEAADTVVYPDEDGFPPTLPAVAAAGRLVVLREATPAFGWQDGIDCLVALDSDELIVLAQAAALRPVAFDPLRRMARLTARASRASDVYTRLAFDVSVGVGGSG
jgi:hypothetical protein